MRIRAVHDATAASRHVITVLARCCAAACVVLAMRMPALPADGSKFVAQQKTFIRELFGQKRYFDVITETRRLMVFDPAGVKDYSFFIDINYFLGGQYRSVIADITSGPAPADFRNTILLSQAYLRLGMNERGLETVMRIPYAAVDARYRYPLMARKAEAFMACGLYRELAGEIRAAGEFVPDGRVRVLGEEVGRYGRVPFKSVPLAVALSVVVPGAGQIYAGKWLQGVVSFIGIASLAGGAYLFHRQGSRDLSYVLIAFSSVMYIGNIYGAYNAAQKTNEDLERNFRNDVQKKCIPPYDPAEEVRDNRAIR